MTAKTISLAQLDARTASETPFEFEFLLDGAATGIFFQVIGGQSKLVTEEVARMINDDRRREAVAELKAKTGGRKEEPAFKPFEEDLAFTNQTAAIRLVGWRGITETYTPALALQLCESNADVRGQVMEKSNNMGNFIKL